MQRVDNRMSLAGWQYAVWARYLSPTVEDKIARNEPVCDYHEICGVWLFVKPKHRKLCLKCPLRGRKK